MLIYLASFLQPEFFGSGRIIGIATGDKPIHVKVESKFLPFIPHDDLLSQYRSETIKDSVKASRNFVVGFRLQLDEFYNSVMRKCKKQKKEVQAILPFQDNDTLASWERSGRNNYRSLVAETLEKLGYSVIVN